MNVQSPILEDAAAAEPLAAQLAAFALDLTDQAIPPTVRTRALHTMLDAAGIALASTRYPFAHPVMAGLMAFDDRGDVPVFGMATRLSARDAATMNGFLCHGLDYDDTHIAGIIHATASWLSTLDSPTPNKLTSPSGASVQYKTVAIRLAARVLRL